MTVLEFLDKQSGPVDATYIARHMGMLLGDVYGELVSAEARGEARVVVDSRRGMRPYAQWELVKEHV